MGEFALESSAFENTQAIPSRHSCEGEDVSPPLRWSNVPEGTRSLALIVDDPDAPGGVPQGAGPRRGPVVGPPAFVAERVHGFVELGLSAVNFILSGAQEQLEQLASEVLPLLRAGA